MFREKILAGAFKRRIIVRVEVVETQNAVSSLFQSEGTVSPDKPASPGDKDGESTGTARGRGVADLLLPGGAAAVEGGGEEVGGGVGGVFVIFGNWRVV